MEIMEVSQYLRQSTSLAQIQATFFLKINFLLMKKFILLTTVLFAFSLSANSQVILQGTVKDISDETPLIGAFITVKGMTGVIGVAELDGTYRMLVPTPAQAKNIIISVSHLGYVEKQDVVELLPIDDGETIVRDFELEQDQLALTKITVTANRVEEELQDVPIAATVLTARNMRDRTVSTTDEALEVVPNILTDAYLPSQPTYSIRGLSTNFADNGSENEIGLYVDDVYQSRAYSFNTTLMDIERVEVLRGPQGTLFGKNTIGGVLHIISEAPKMGNLGAIELTAGNFQYTQVRAKANFMPVTDKLAVRLTGAYKKRSGWLREENPDVAPANQTKFGGGRAAVLYRPNDKLDITLRGNYSRDDAAEFTVDLIRDTINNIDRFDVPNISGTDRVVSQSEEKAFFFRDNYGTSAKLNYKLGRDLTLTSVSAYNTATTDFLRDFDVSPADAMHFRAHREYSTLSQEIRIATPRENRKFFYVAGLFFQKEDIETHDTLRLFSGMIPVYRIEYNDPALDTIDASKYREGGCTHGIMSGKSMAVFGAGSLELDERIRLNAGLRIIREEKGGDFWQDVVNNPIYTRLSKYLVQLASRNDPRPLSNTDVAWSGNIGLDFKTTDNTLLYINIARGYKGVGFNIALNPDSSSVDIQYDPEYLNNYEFGIKLKYQNRFLFNAAAFITDYQNKQEAAPVGAALRIPNAKSAEGIGAEFEFVGVWTEHFRTNISAGALQLEYRDFPFIDANNNPINLSGNKLYKSPNFTFQFSPELAFPFAKSAKVKFRGDFNYVGKAYNDIYNTELIARKGTGVVNARLAFSFMNERYSLAIWGKNLTDALYFQHGWVTNIGSQVAVNPPRTLGVEMRINFYGK